MILRSALRWSPLFFAAFLLLSIPLQAHEPSHQKTHRHPELDLPKAPPDARSSAAFGATQLSTQGIDASCVYMTKDHRQFPVVSWIEKSSHGQKEQTHMFFAFWDPKTRSFQNPKEIPVPQNISVHEEGMPKLTFRPDGSIFVLFERSFPSEGSPWGITTLHYLISSDNGTTWSKSQPLIQDASLSKTQSFSAMTELSDGSLGIAWIDNHTDAETQTRSRCVMFARLHKDGSLSTPIMVEPRACECCRIAMEQPTNHHIQIVYRGLRKEATRDLAVTTSSDNGSTFSPPKSVSNDLWELNACPHNGPSIAATQMGADKSYVVWYAGGKSAGIHFAELDSSGGLSNKQIVSDKGRFAQVCALPNGTAVVAYSQAQQGDNSRLSGIRVCQIADSPSKDTLICQSECSATYPVLTSVEDQKIVVAWRDSNGIFYRLVELAKAPKQASN